jgi:hypothetical protein
MMKTEKVVEYTKCPEKPIRQKNKIDVSENGIEVWIYGSTACLYTLVG